MVEVLISGSDRPWLREPITKYRGPLTRHSMTDGGNLR